MTVITVALLQMTAFETDQAANQAKGDEYCRRARDMGADIALFPEMWNVGYTSGVECDQGDVWRAAEKWDGDSPPTSFTLEQLRTVWQGHAVTPDGPFVSHFRALAQELGMAIAITYLQRWDGPPRNAMSLIDRHGDLVMTYAKVHTCDFSMHEASLTPGDDFLVRTLDTAQGEVKIGAMICYDREFPESARILMLKGAEVILTPNCSTLRPIHVEQFRLRAYENMVGVAMTNYAVPQANGHSVAFDPIVFPESDGAPRDTLVVEAGEREGIYLAPFDLEAIRAYRRSETSGNAFRKPHRYGMLASLDVQQPFIRVNPTGEVYDRKRR